MQWQQVRAFVGSDTTESLVAYPASEADCLEVLRICREQELTVCVRGSGRSYGDAILNDGNALLDMSQMNRILDFDEASGRIRAEAGAKIVDIFAACHHLGFTLPASPTDSTISVGGALVLLGPLGPASSRGLGPRHLAADRRNAYNLCPLNRGKPRRLLRAAMDCGP
jgi:FAD/FMN-containing dehydrogenase